MHLIIPPAMSHRFPSLNKARRLVGLAFASLAAVTGLQAQSTYSTPYVVTTLAGTALSTGTTDATGSAARFDHPEGVAVDAAGNFFVSDSSNHTIRKITPAGLVTTFAGTAGSSGPADGTGSAARFNGPQGLTFDSAGNLYVADTGNSSIRKITPAGVVTTFAGLSGFSGTADGQGTAARFSFPSGVAAGGNGIYVADTSSHTIRLISYSGLVTTFAGTAGSHGAVDGTGSAARFDHPYGVAVDQAGNVYVADSANYTIRKITYTGVVSTYAGATGVDGFTDGTGSAAQFSYPRGLAADPAGNVYVIDSGNCTVRLIDTGGAVTTLAGTALTSGSVDGTGAAARFNEAYGIAVYGSAHVVVADTYNSTIRVAVPPVAVSQVIIFKGTENVQTAAGSAVVNPLPQGPSYGGPFNFTVSVQGTNMSDLTPAPVITLAAGSTYPSTNATQHNDGTLVYSASDDEWKYGLNANNYGGQSLAGRDAAFAFGDYGMQVAGNSFTLHFADGATYPVNTPVVTLTGGSWVAGRYVIDASQTLTITTNAYPNYSHNADGAIELQLENSLVDVFTFYSDDTSAPNFATVTIPGGTLTAGRDYRGSASFYGLMDKNGSVPGLSGALAAAVYAMDTKFVISTISTPNPSAQATLYRVGHLSDLSDANNVYSEVRDVTKTGGVIYAVGSSIAYVGSTVADTGFLWSSTDGLSALPNFVDTFTTNPAFITGSAITPDAAYIAGRARAGSGGNFRHANRVTRSGLANLDLGTVAIGTGNVLAFSATATISSDGSVMYGFARYTSANGKTQAARFTSGPSITAIPFLNVGDDNSFAIPHGASSDGSVMIGTSANQSISGGAPDVAGNRAFRYVYPAGTVTGIPMLGGGTWNAALGLSPDGNIAFVSGNSTAHPGGEVYLYNNTAGTSIALGSPTGYITPSNIAGMNSDGSLVALSWGNGGNLCFLHNANGWFSLSTIMTRAGVDLTNWSIDNVYGMSADGTLIWGVGTHNGPSEGWVVEFNAGYLAGYGSARDFNGDGKGDMVWQNSVTGERYVWLMNNTTLTTSVALGTVSTDWHIASTADFNGDSKPDIVWENTSTGDRYLWMMNGTTYVSGFSLGNVSTVLRIVATADFNGDGKADILFENTVTGKRVIWLMNGTALISTVNLGIVDANYHIVAAADFNGDGKADILFENTVTGDRYIWLMNGTAYQAGVDLGVLSTDWHIAAVADFNGDGKNDILLENSISGDRYVWVMNGTAYVGGIDIGVVGTDWHIAP